MRFLGPTMTYLQHAGGYGWSTESSTPHVYHGDDDLRQLRLLSLELRVLILQTTCKKPESALDRWPVNRQHASVNKSNV